MKINILRGILVVLLVWNCITIFNFSSENAEKSGNTSQKVTEAITKNVKSIQKLEKSKKIEVIDKVESVIRKIAHFSIYTLLGILLMALLSTYNINTKNKIIATIIIGAVYATSDEIHQIFVPGRSGEITDVMIDSLGVCLGTAMVLWVLKLKCIILKNKK